MGGSGREVFACDKRAEFRSEFTFARDYVHYARATDKHEHELCACVCVPQSSVLN